MKKSSPKVLILVTALLTILSAACSTLSLSTPESRRDFAEAVIENWSGYSRIQAARLMQEYGPPDQVKHAELVWNNKGVWQKIRVWDVTPYYDSNLGAANIEQTVAYSVPMGKRLEVLDFSRDIRISQDGTGISVRGTSEESNFTALSKKINVVWIIRAMNNFFLRHFGRADCAHSTAGFHYFLPLA